MSRREAGRVQSVCKAMDLLSCLAQAGGPLTLGELSSRTGMPRATVHGLLAAMRPGAVVEQSPADGRYRLGIRLFEYGCAVSRGWNILEAAAGPMGWVAEETGETVSLAALDRGDLKLPDFQLAQWRLMHIGAQPVPPSLIKHWLQYFPHHKYDTNYGLSESTGPGCVHLGVDNVHKVGAIGVPGYGWKIKIVDEQNVPVKQGDVGELCVKGPGVMVCYYHNPEATAEVLENGWLHTGDMARQDEDGFVFLVDRKKDVIM